MCITTPTFTFALLRQDERESEGGAATADIVMQHRRDVRAILSLKAKDLGYVAE